jgi:K+-sensing histidine kinase KdpD
MNRDQPSSEELPEIEIPLERVAKFMRQISHDVRNNLGSMDLQAAYLAELATDSDVTAELRNLRGMISSTAKALQNISRSFQFPTPQPVTLSARILFEDFRERMTRQHPEEAARIAWGVKLGEEQVAVDIELIFGTLLEFCRNAISFHEGKAPLRALVAARDGRLQFELTQNRQTVDGAIEEWGQHPLLSTRRGGYGLGLFHARQVTAAHGGRLEFSHCPESGELLTRLEIPLVEE